ncbi:MAG: hypothetical protein ABI047_03215 [Jatrophihabitantaceae bacterium]
MTEGASIPPFAQASALKPSASDRLVRASARIRRYCAWHIYPQLTQTVVLDTRGGQLLMLPTLELVSVAAVTLTRPGQVLDPADFRKSRKGMIGLLSGCWPVGFEAVSVTFTHGHAEVPEDLVDVAVSIATRMPQQNDAVTQEVVDKVSTTYGGALAGGFSAASGLTIAETTVLDTYRLRPSA